MQCPSMCLMVTVFIWSRIHFFLFFSPFIPSFFLFFFNFLSQSISMFCSVLCNSGSISAACCLQHKPLGVGCAGPSHDHPLGTRGATQFITLWCGWPCFWAYLAKCMLVAMAPSVHRGSLTRTPVTWALCSCPLLWAGDVTTLILSVVFCLSNPCRDEAPGIWRALTHCSPVSTLLRAVGDIADYQDMPLIRWTILCSVSCCFQHRADGAMLLQDHR